MFLFMKKRTLTILGRKTDMHLMIACVMLTSFIIINTSCSCINKQCNGKTSKKCQRCNNTPCNCKNCQGCNNTPCTCKNNAAPSLEMLNAPPDSNVVGADQATFSDLASV